MSKIRQAKSDIPANTKNPRILITGGAGFIGSHLAKTLAQRGHSVTVLDNLSPQIHRKDAPRPDLDQNVSFIKGSILDQKLVRKIIGNYDVLVHLGAETGTGQSMYEIEKYCDVNINGTAVILEALVNRPNSVRKIILSSSRAVYGEGKYRCKKDGFVYPDSRLDQHMQKKDFEVKCPLCGKNVAPVPTDEDSEMKPASIYALTKYAQEQILRITSNSLHIPYVILRFQNVYGDGQSLSNPYTGVLSVFSAAILAGRDINIFEDGKEARDFIHVEDVVRACVKAVENKSADNEILNVGSGKATSIKKIAEILKKVLGSKKTRITVSGNYRLGDVRHNMADIRKIRKLLKFSPKISLTEGLHKYTRWVKNQRPEPNRYEKSLEEMRRAGLFKEPTAKPSDKIDANDNG